MWSIYWIKLELTNKIISGVAETFFAVVIIKHMMKMKINQTQNPN